MIIRKVTLENFGLYAGVVEFDLVPRHKGAGPSPIILIGGKNGAGKTTLLEAVRLALYGKRALGPRVSQVDYEAHLLSRISRSAQSGAAAILIEFDYAESGVVNTYRVRRDWAGRGKAVVETLLLEKDGTIVTAVPRDEWHHFLQELVPPGVSQLFFFDGEKISEIAEGEKENDQLADAIRGLLGIELVGRLRIDLGLFIARNQREEDSEATARFEALSRDITVAEERAAELVDEIAGLNSQKESQARAAEQVRRQFVAEGGDAALGRAKTELELADAKRNNNRAEHELRDLANKMLPFALAPKLMKAFGEGLALANGHENSVLVAKLEKAIVAWRAEGQPLRDANWTSGHWRDLHAFLASQGSDTSKANSPALREVGDGSSTLSRLNEIETIVKPKAFALLAELDTLSTTSQQLEASLARASNAASGVLLDELRLADQKLGATEARWKARQDELSILRGQIVTMNREQKRMLEEQVGAVRTGERAELARRTALALANYEARLLERKLKQLSVEFVGRFNHIVRKADFVVDVRIDPTTFEATLIGKDGVEIPKKLLSAGEKQIYAIAMLWALGRTSGRPLPMIIDTPLARLDSEHRENLIRNYFPAASHQVILLSTDTEIDDRLKRELGSAVSHSYQLHYDQTAGCTSILPGYFDSPSQETGLIDAL